jgi:nucleoside-diphosphate-sugar epimerase
MQVLIVGVGYLGAALCATLTQQGHTVVTVDHKQFANYPHYQLDACGSTINAVFDAHKFDAVVHTAASIIGITPAELDKDSVVTENMSSLLNVYTAALKHKVQRFLFPSTIAIKGETLSAYACSKLMGEKLLRITDPRLISATSVRLTNLYGPGQSASCPHESIVNKAVRYAIEGGLLSVHNGSAERDYLHISDAAAALSVILQHPPVDPAIDVGCGYTTTTADVIDLVKAKVVEHYGSHKVKLAQVKARPGDANRTVADIANIQKLYSSIGKQWQPMSLSAGIDTLLETK